ncbi:NUDIX domain-containing protein [Paracoccus sp. Z330]|uniref:ADP-ribose pyrophosphatase n=1 Tax=Paracoccus onchidii TaxID=3017813 RepID=A0ABT4ZIM4_9RHOB|nr:NUDIX domain-containing protein [Paracoccus onchidii]MDB6178853.1 NUDIX domain-containing protein [Paracoccus onchidii]
MNDEIYLVGLLAEPAMLSVFGLVALGQDRRLHGRLGAAPQAGLNLNGWPELHADEAVLPYVRVHGNDALQRYASVMGLVPVNWQGVSILGVKGCQEDRVGGNAPQIDLAVAVAQEILEAGNHLSARDIAGRLPMIAVWADSRLRAVNGPISGGNVVAGRDAQDIQVRARAQVYAGFFAVEKQTLSHRTHEGGFTPEMTREAFVMGDAVVVLPWDPIRDRVLLIEQFRFAPAIRHDRQPWLLEAVAGRIDAGESPEQAARREAQEEAGLELGRMFAAFHHYPSPGAAAEFLYMYVGIADLPDDSAGIHGLDGEVEDIRGHILECDRLIDMVLANEITNGPLAGLALWLQHRKPDLRQQLMSCGAGLPLRDPAV